MRRPKAAIPILPPPDNQQNRGRGRTTQQYQQNNQFNNIQQIEQEIKPNTMEDDEKAVPGQFDNVQIEQSTPHQESQEIEILDTDRIVNAADEDVEKNTDINMHIPLSTSSIKDDDIDDNVSVKELMEVTSHERDTISHDQTTLDIAETEHELTNIESTISESTIIEKAAA